MDIKYANINSLMPKYPQKKKTRLVNIGDYLQFYAVEYILSRAISRQAIVGLNIGDIKKYDRPIILPLNWGIFDENYMENGIFAFPSNVTPVWFAATLGCSHKNEYFNTANIQYLKLREPIGCRDEKTRDILRALGVEAYITGCMTAVLPRRKNLGKTNWKQVFLADAPIEVEKFIPEEIWENSEVIAQQYYWEETLTPEEIRKRILDQYNRYQKEASLIITSRLHVASPCTAMGIPVILCKKIIDERFGFLDKLIPLYDVNNFETINWNETVPEYEEVKEKIIGLQLLRIKEETAHIKEGTPFSENLISKYKEIDAFYSNKTKREYADFREVLYGSQSKRIDEIICENGYSQEDSFSWKIFGCGTMGENVYSYIKANYPNSIFLGGIDNYRTEDFHEKKCIGINESLKNNDADITICASIGGGQWLHNQLSGEEIRAKKIYFLSDEFISKPRGATCGLDSMVKQKFGSMELAR